LANNDTDNKLTIANEYIEKLNGECVELKCEIVKLQNINNMLRMQNNKYLINKQSPQLSPRNYTMILPESNNSAEVLKRYHKLEEQNKRMIKKNELIK
jgi:hypothetical protein